MTFAALALATCLTTAPVAPTGPAVPPTPPRPAFSMTDYLNGKTVLVVGDSMIVTGLEIWLKDYLRKHGARYQRLAWASSTTIAWAKGKRLDWALRKHRPDLVLVVLGSNELFLDKPQAMAPHVRTIVQKINPRPFRWIGPPIWRKDSGIVKVIEENVPPGMFYRFNGRKIHRDPDGRHPSVKGAKSWLEDIIVWFEARVRLDHGIAP
jgi:lysophospholipase L1-like esterase